MKKLAVITGASSGIGKEFAKILASQNYQLILVARRKERLVELSQSLYTECEIICADLSQEDECYRLYDCIRNKKIDVFINNAGFGDYGLFLETDIKKEVNMIHVNVQAVHILTKLIIQHMQKEDSGYLLNVASVAGIIPAGPYMSTYYATKNYVRSLTQGIHYELKEKKSHVSISCLCPGPVDTEFNEVAEVEFALKGIKAADCASYALKNMFEGKCMIIPTLSLKLAMAFGRFLPQSLYISISAHQQKKKRND